MIRGAESFTGALQNATWSRTRSGVIIRPVDALSVGRSRTTYHDAQRFNPLANPLEQTASSPDHSRLPAKWHPIPDHPHCLRPTFRL